MQAIIQRGPRRIREILGELDYAQRRMFEIQTGVPLTGEDRARQTPSVDELERLFALETEEPVS